MIKLNSKLPFYAKSHDTLALTCPHCRDAIDFYDMEGIVIVYTCNCGKWKRYCYGVDIKHMETKEWRYIPSKEGYASMKDAMESQL